MELKVFRDVLPAAGADCTAKAELPLETELLISDYLPPVQRIVKCFAKPVVLQKQLTPGRLTLEGYLRCTVYYQGEEGAGLCQTEQKLPFTKALELPSFAATAWTACVEGQTEYLNCRAVNPRRIEVRGAYGLVVSVHAQLSTEVITALSEGGIEQKPVTLAGVRRAATLEKLVTIEGALTFPKPPAAILDITGTAEVGELKRMQGKAVAKGVLHVLCGWRAEGDAALRSQTADLPFNQILDADGLSEDCRCLCVLEPVGFGRVSITSAQEHDKRIAFTSQMAHIISNAYIKSPTARQHDGFSAGSYKDLTRVAWLNPDMWAELFLENRENLLFELGTLIEDLTKYKDAIERNDFGTLRQLLDDGRRIKEEVDGE